MRSISVRALALLCLVGLAACVGSPEVVGSARRHNGSARGSSTEGVTPGAGSPGSTAPYEGFGTWIDIYDTAVWEHPVHAVDSMAAHGVRTIYLQTSNFNRNGPFVHPDGRGVDRGRGPPAGTRGGRLVPARVP